MFKLQVASCLCGCVTVSVNQIKPKFTLCHCDTCRKWGEGPLFAMQCTAEVVFDGLARVKEYDSSPCATRGFCAHCGTHILYRLHKTGCYNIPVGLLPDLPNLEMTMQYFSDRRPEYYCFANDT
ncbi:MAG: hypothetical protein ACJA13_001003 [Paraglaciecola sp.]|jgi:hypothetical protein